MNPFYLIPHTPEAYFCDRAKETEDILSFLDNGSNVTLISPRRYGKTGFQVNLSRISGGSFLFAHCTVPLSLVRSYRYDTHFESGIGVAIHGELPEGPVTLFKLSPDLRHMLCLEARLAENPYDDNLCRTQVVVEAPGASDYFLRTPICNHHVLFPGKL